MPFNIPFEDGFILGTGQPKGDIDMAGFEIYDSTGPLNIGTAAGAASSHSLATGDVLITGKLEVDDFAYFDSRVIFAANQIQHYGSTSGTHTRVFPDQTLGQFLLLPGTSHGSHIVIGDANFATRDFDHAATTNPTVFVHSITDPNSDNAQWLSLTHNQTDGVLGTGKGGLRIDDDTGKGSYVKVAVSREQLTFAADPGDASKTTSGLIPDGCILLGVTGRVITGGTNASSMNIGDGSTADLYGATISIADTTTFGPADHTAALSNPQIAAGDVTVTGVGGNIFDMVIDITAHYITLSAASSD